MGSNRVKRIVEWLRERRVPGIACAALLGLSLASPAHAEGLSNIDAGGGNVVVQATQVVYAYVGAGQNLDIGVAKVANGGGANDANWTVQYWSPAGATASCTITAASAVGAAGSSCPFGNLTSPTAGVWTLRMRNTALVNTVNGAADSLDWNVDVQTGTTSVPGRVWTEVVRLTQTGTASTVPQFSLYHASQQGYVYRSTLRSYHGATSLLATNASGAVQRGTCNSLYRSFISGNQLGEPPDPNAQAPASVFDGIFETVRCNPYKQFFNDPRTAGLPASAPRWNYTTGAQVTEWILPAIATATVTNFIFGPDGSTAPPRDGALAFDVAGYTGLATFRVDVDNNGSYADPIDRTFTAGVATGSNTVAFDGIDGLGAPIPATATLRFQIELARIAEIHFTMDDLEEFTGGLEIERLNGPGAGTPAAFTLYWNDSTLPNPHPEGCPPPTLIDGSAGVNSTGGAHGWTSPIGGASCPGPGGWGDVRAIDNWTFGSTTPVIVDVVAGPVPLLNVAKSAAPSPFQTGQPATYTITITNDGGATTAGNITLTDTLPAGITLASATGTNWSCTGTTALTCTFTGTIAPGANTALTLNVNVGLGAVSTGGNNSATARGGGDPDCPATGTTAAHCTGTVGVSVISGYVCSPSTIFVAQATPTQLNAQTYGAGGTAFTPIGPAVWSYNAIAYRAADNFIYGISQNLDAGHPQNRLLRVDPGTGAVSNLGAITGGLPAAGGINVGGFDGSGNYIVGTSGEQRFYRVNLTTLVATPVNLAPAQTLDVADFTFANGFLWGIVGTNPPQAVRINPANGATARFNVPIAVVPAGVAFGASWTFGNGNLGFSDNNTGNVYQVRVTNPTGTPTFARVSLSPGPTSGQNDGTACVSPPIDLAIAKTGPASVGPGGAISWTVTVTNNGPLASSGFTVTDTVPAGVTGIASPTPGCTVAGNTVTCVGGTLANGASFTFTINATAPNPFATPITNTARVEGNETDPVPGNNTATQTVTPPPPANVVVSKALTGESGLVAGRAEPGEQLTYTITLTNTGGQAATGYGVTDTLDPNVTYVSSTGGGTFAAGSVTWSGLTVPVGAPVTLTVTVQVDNPIPDGVARIGNSAYQTGGTPPNCTTTPLPANCTSIPTRAKVTQEKIAGSPATTGVPNEYRITYTVTVRNAGGSAATYDLADTLTFNGATVTAISAPVYASTTGDIQSGFFGAFAPPSGGTIVTAESIGALGVETWTYTVTYTITNPAVAANCAAPSGGLRNVAAVGGDSPGVPPVATCSGAPNVSILKAAATPVPTGTPNQFTLTYTVDVTNTGTLPGSYALGDTFTFNGATVNAVSAAAYSSTSGDTQTGTLGVFGPPTGGTIVTGEAIAVGGAERWVYTVTYAVTNPATAQDCASPTGGLRNSAELGGAMNGQATICTGAPAVGIAKAVSGPTPTGIVNEYRLSYLVTVRNDGTLPGTYNLTDTFTLPGAAGVTVGAVTHGGADPLATALGTLTAAGGTIVTNETIAAGAIETYAYDVVFTVANPATVGLCSASGGLRNQAALGGSSSGFVSTCSDVPNIVVTKVASAPAATGAPNQYVIAYVITVNNTGSAAGLYDLSDTFAYNGAVVDAVSAVSHAGTDPLSTSLGALTTAGGTIVNAEPIGAATSETYSYSVVLTLTTPAAANNCASPSGGLRNTASLGGAVSGSGAACSGAPVIAVTKALTGETGTQAGIAEPGETLTYTITLTNTGNAAETGYSVTDALDPNTVFVSASGGGTYAAGSVHWTGLAVAAGGTTTVTVTVIVSAPIAPGVTQIGNVAHQTGTTPPSCPPASPQCVLVPTAGSVTLAKALTGENGTRAGVAEAGEQLTYTITLTNAGGSAAVNYGVTDRLDPNTTFVSATNGGTFAAGAVTWSGLTVPANGTLVLTVVVAVNDPLPPGVTQIGNVAYETGSVPPACPPASPQCVLVPTEPQVAIVKALAAESGTQAGAAEPGEQLTYTITLTNSGGVAATNYGVTDQLDPNVTFVSATNGGTFAAGSVTWSGLTVPAGGNVVLTVVATVGTPIPPGVTSIGNVAYETGTTPPTCPPSSPQCVVVPTAGAVTIAKALATESGTQAGVAEPGEQLTYTITLTNSGGSAATNYGVTDTLDPSTTFVSADNGGTFAAGAVTWTGLTVPAGGSVVLTVVTTVNTPIPPGVTSIANVAYQTGTTPPACPPAGGQCVVTPTAARVAIAKTAGTPTSTGTPNQFSITYVATARNDGGSAGTYALTDTLAFNGATVNAISTPVYGTTTGDTQNGTPGTFVPPTGGTIVTGEDLASLGAETWTYTVTYTVTDAALAANCASPTGGLRNSAAITGGGSAATCSGAADVSLVKTAAIPLPTGTPNQFVIGYTVRVTNTGTLAGTYDLDDVLTFNGATVNAVTAPAFVSPSGDPQTGTLGVFGAGGGTIVTGEPIAVGGTEIWTYSVTYTITDPAVAQNCANPSAGLRNDAELGGSFNGQSTTCTGAPAVVIGKSASGPMPTGALNQYAITYLVNVQNNGTLPGTYDLFDTFTLPGTTGVTVTPVSHAGADPLATTLGTLTATGGTIVTNETIAAGSNENYTYTVQFTIADPAAVGSCSASGGLRNQAALGGSSSGQVSTCSDVPDITVAKTGGTPVPTGTPNQFTLTYIVTVTNGGAAAGAYDLADAFTFNGATVNGVSAVTHGGADPLATTLGTLTAAGGTIVDDESIAAGGSETYTYTVTYTVTDAATAANCAVPTGGLRNNAALGGSSSGQASTCAGVPNVGVVKALTAESGTAAGIAEPGEQLTYTITLSNTGSAAATNYGVTDTLDPNVTFVSATNGGTFAAGAVTWTPLTIPAGGTLTLTVVTRVVSPIPPGADSIGNVAYPTGTTPPNCASTPTPPGCVTIPTQGLVSIAKSVVDGDGDNTAEPGETLTYTIVLTNTNGGAVTNYGVTDPLDPNLVFVSASNGGTHAGGVVTWTGLTVPAGGSLTLTLVTTVVSPIPAGVVQIGNVAHATGDPPPNCAIVPPPSNCNSIPTGGTPQLQLTKTANTTTVAPLGTVVYTITVSNVGTAAAAGVTISDPIPTGITAYAWTCTSAGGVVCPNASGSGALAETIATFPAGGSVTYAVTATFGPTPPTDVANTVSVTPTGVAVCAPSGAAPPCVSTVSVIVVRGGPAMPVPSLGWFALTTLSLGLWGIAWRMRRRWRGVPR